MGNYLFRAWAKGDVLEAEKWVSLAESKRLRPLYEVRGCAVAVEMLVNGRLVKVPYVRSRP